MSYSSFNVKHNNALAQPMFFGESVSLSRYDQQKHKIFEDLIEKQLSFFWRPEEVDLSRDSKEFAKLNEGEQHLFISNLKYQMLLDSVQGRSPNACLLPIVSLPELETWIETWSFSETIHSRSYTHIIRNIFTNPTKVLDSVLEDEEVVKRADSVTKAYDDLYVAIRHIENLQAEGKDTKAATTEAKKKLYLCMVTINVLEAIRFYVSFACAFAFAERSLMEGNAKIMKLIARDEALHLNGTQHILNLFKFSNDDYEMNDIAAELEDEARQIFIDAANEEKAWAQYLFSKGSMLGLNAQILSEYVEYITNQRMQAVNLESAFPEATSNPIPWMNAWLKSDNVQVAPQESEISSYLVGALDSNISDEDFADISL
jgi:ribonucleoside-diphosphate reductase beta chain